MRSLKNVRQKVQPRRLNRPDWTLDVVLFPDGKGSAYTPDRGDVRYAGNFPDKIPMETQLQMTFREKYAYDQDTAKKTGVKACYVIKDFKVRD